MPSLLGKVNQDIQIPPSVSTIKHSGRKQSFVGLHSLAEFGDVSCLQFNYLRVETLTPTWEDLVGHLLDNLVGHLSV
jgi:hypothetical protein